MQNADQKIDEAQMPSIRRWSGLYTLGLIILLLIFFALHQKRNTGFFTDKFGPAEMVALYLPILLSMVAPILRITTGRYDPARFIEAASDLCLAIGSLWLWNNFPFNFAHIADLFQPGLRVALSWLNDGIGRIILLLQIIIGFISALTTMVSYLRERPPSK